MSGQCSDKQQQYCDQRFDTLERMQQDTLDLLRGTGPEPGLVGDVRSHSELIADLRNTMYGADNDGIAYKVRDIELNGLNRKSDEQSRRDFYRAIILRLVTAAILALAAAFVAMYSDYQLGRVRRDNQASTAR